jgi:hypothetical protein
MTWAAVQLPSRLHRSTMARMNPLQHLLAIALTATALASCAQTTPPAPQTESQRLARELRELIGPATCTADSQCRSLPVGARACGGPAGYWAWSTHGVDETRLTDLAARQAQAQQRELASSGRRSNCSVAVDPGVACVANHCRTHPVAGEPMDPQAIELDRPFLLRHGGTGWLADGALEVVLAGVESDSRCPKGEQCVWAGLASVRVQLRLGNGASETRRLQTGPGVESTTRLGGFELKLIDLSPLPVTRRAITPAAYAVTLSVSRNESASSDR